MSFDFPQSPKPTPGPRRKGGGSLIFLIIGVALFFFMTSGRGTAPTEPQIQSEETLEYTGLPELTSKAENRSQRRGSEGSASSGRQAMPRGDRSNSSDWSMEEVETGSKKTESQAVSRKSTEGDWSIEEVDGKKKTSPPRFELSGPGQSGTTKSKAASGEGDWSIEVNNPPKKKAEGDWSIEGVKK